MNSQMNRQILSKFVLISGAAMLVSAACTVRTPGTETPPPVDATDDNAVAKTFFEKPETVTKNGKTVTVMKRRTFICGWATLSESSERMSKDLLHATVSSSNCNVEFEVKKNAVVGRLVNPSFPDPDGTRPENRARWREVITIPLEGEHYYYERAKDQYGRDTNEMIKNSARSHYSARPMIDLAFDRITINDWGMGLFESSRTGQLSSIDGIEWDKANGFLGFTASVQDPDWGAAMGARVRFNFKAIEANPGFVPTPYDPRNANFLNVVRLIGERPNGGLEQAWKAVKWDLSKTHDIYLYGFPETYVPVVRDVIDDWNATLAAIDPNKNDPKKRRPKTLNLNMKPMKYPFDLRYPMLVWVDDQQISGQSPLGIGKNIADVRTGEAVWGQATLWGGRLETFVKHSLVGPSVGPSTGGTSGGTDGLSAKGKAQSYAPLMFPTAFNPRPLHSFADALTNGASPAAMRFNPIAAQRLFSDRAKGLMKHRLETLRVQKLKQGQQLTANEIALAENQAQEHAETMYTRMAKSLQDQMAEMRAKSVPTNLKSPGSLYGFLPPPSKSAWEKTFGADESGVGLQGKIAHMHERAKAQSERAAQNGVYDLDRRLIDVGPSLVSALAALKNSGTSYELGLRNAIKSLITHEVGHVLGLGHQFKENILPAPGSVPSKYLRSLEAQVADNMTNSTSVMGYRHGEAEVLTPYELIKPGFQDELTLRYLYNQEYPTFRRGSDDEDFSFVKIPPSGLIPDANPDKPENRTSYFPQCNDSQASFMADPYCNRDDRGYDAQTIVKGYFDDLNRNKISLLHAFSDAPQLAPDYAEGWLWETVGMRMRRIRIFYDFMRQEYETQLLPVLKSKRDLDGFSRVCTGEIQGSELLEGIFKKNPELKELCKVNRYAVIELAKFVATPGPNRTRMDWNGAVSSGSLTGGDGQMHEPHMFGSYRSLSVLPYKYTALDTLTTAYPLASPWEHWMFPVPRFTGDDGLFSYSTFYSREFTAATAAVIERDLQVDSKEHRPSLDLPVLALGHFLNQQADSKDALRTDGESREIIESVRNQSQFRVTMKAVLVELQSVGEVTRAKQLVGSLYDPDSGKTTGTEGVYLLKNGQLLVRPRDKNFVFPISKQPTFIDDRWILYWAYHVEYDRPHYDLLANSGIKNKLATIHKTALDSCIDGKSHGLESYFAGNIQPFKGFLVMDGVGADPAKQRRFIESIAENFAEYEAATKAAGGAGLAPQRCERALDTIGVVVSTASLMTGYWLPDTNDQLATK